MRYQHSFQINRPQSEVLEFHRHPTALEGITPPPIIMRMHQAPDPLKEGDEMRFTMWVGPFPIRWHSRIEDVDDHGFTDRQLEGPFLRWIHRHEFISLAKDETEAKDNIEFTFRPHLIWGPVGLGMALGLPVLFGFRAWKTKRLLETR
jgi:ligand-binding SRPBCC domain-containing protein